MSVPQLEFSPLLDWVEGRLSPQGAQDTELLLAGGDESARQTLRWLRAFIGARHAITFADPPASVHAALVQRFAAHADTRRQPGLLQRMVAALISGDALQPAVAAGMRGEGSLQAQPRQLVFSCTAADIVLNIHRRPHDERYDLSGQIFPHEQVASGDWGILLISDRAPDVTHTDDLGEFSFEAVVPGDYTINLELGRLAITMPMIGLER